MEQMQTWQFGAQPPRKVRVIRRWKFVVLVEFQDTGERCKVSPRDLRDAS